MFTRILLSAAIAAAFSTQAFAEVTIGGSIEADVYYVDSQAKGYKGEVELDVEPRLFFSGSDKLDNGSKVIWKIWTGVENYRDNSATGGELNTGSSARTWGNREAWGGWQGEWGTLRLGKIYSPTYLKLDWPYGNLGGAMHVAEVGVIGFNPENAINYDSPNWGGFTFSGQYSFRGQNNQVDGKSSEYFYDITAGFNKAGFMVDAGYQETRNDGGDSKDKMYFVAGGYNFGAFTMKGGYKSWDCQAGAGCNSFAGPQQEQYWLQGIYSAGKHTVGLTYNYFTEAENAAGNTIDDSDTNVLFGQWNYTLSSNTVGYVQLRYAMNGGNGSIGANYGTSYGNAVDADSYRLLFGTWTGF
ncbi:porin [Jeongeupia sp. USM3]|uniref:porin n=1 Tax=Jeongeupia sp. USM3 TaxID=1906741 RepID=UPI00089DFFA9|nr:porin [Jeongeupia sp. USM3]AOX99610.1 hypothetical protein BJP62_03555 [Jeongeupia sp. USM3]